jgi:hypothetical protein
LHKLNRVVNSLIFEITNKLFYSQAFFDPLSLDQKKTEVEKIKKWCDENATLSQEDMVIKILQTADEWVSFHKALETAKQGKYDSLLPIIVDRFNDFKSQYDWPTKKGLMAETMFDIGSEKYIGTVREWNKDTTDTWVNLWSSLFLLKYDKDNYEQAMKQLASVLKKCDGTSYYPHAMDLLLSINDKRTLKLAEGILDKEGFQRFVDWDYYLNFIKKLLVLKSDYTFNFISKKLDSSIQEEVQRLSAPDNHVNMLSPSDEYVLSVDKLKGDKPGYPSESNVETRLAYKKMLSKWFITQYNLLKEGKPNELHLNITQVNAPVTFIDSPHN